MMELNKGNRDSAKYELSRAIHECPSDGSLWGLSIELSDKSRRKEFSINAMRKTDKSPYVIISIAKIFWKEKKYNKAREWFKNALLKNANIGDIWIYYYAFEIDV